MTDNILRGLKNKKVLITGGSGGIGSSLVALFAGQGARVGIHYATNRQQAEQLKKQAARTGGRTELFQSDLLDADAAKSLAQEFIRRFGGLDVLINNAGGPLSSKPFATLSEHDWDQTFALNVKAPFFIAQQAFGEMQRHGGGKIINISSIAAKYGGSAETLHYGASKAALDAVTIGLSRQGAAHRILVNSIRGGFIQTAAHKRLGRSAAFIKQRIQKIPLKRPGTPADVARLALFLASDAGDFITGEIFNVSGGD